MSWAFSSGACAIAAWNFTNKALAGIAAAAASGPMFATNYISSKDLYHNQPWLIWTNVAMDSALALSCAVIFACIWWMAGQMRGLPRLRAYLWILTSFGAYILISSITRLMGVVTIWWPVYSFTTAIKILCAAASLATAIILVRTTPLISANLKRFIEESSNAQIERKKAEEKLLKSEDRFRLAFLGINGVGLWEWDLQRNLMTANDTFANFYGVDPELAAAGARADLFTGAVPAEDLPSVRAETTESIRTGRTFCVEHRVTHADGSVRWVEARGECKYGPDRKPMYLSGVMIDISGRKRNEETLLRIEKQKFEAIEALLVSIRQAELARTEAAHAVAQTNERFRLLVEGVSDYALLTIDSNGVVTSWNRGAERLLGYSEAEILGRHFSRIFTPEDIADGVPERVIERVRTQGRAEDDGWRVRADGERFWASVTKTAFARDGDRTSGMAQEFAVIIQDTTERKKVAMALEEASQARYRLHENFLSHVSHELRTPLTAIYFFTSNVMDGIFGELTSDQRAHLAYALENAEQLKAMVDDLLDITRVGSARLTVHAHRVNCVRLIADAINTCQTNAQAKAIELLSEFPATPASEMPFAWVDANRVRQILINLIGNAIKFSPRERSITVRARIYEADSSFLHLSVNDQGCGIAPEDMERIFNRLAQVEGQSEASRAGLGLGLFITKELVDQHGGRIWLESKVGQGSTFHFTLPVFSLTRLCAPILTRPNLERGSLTLLSIDLTGYGGAWSDIQPRIQKTVEECIHPSQDVLLNLTGDQGTAITLFVVAFTGLPGEAAALARRIEGELKRFDYAARLNPVIHWTTLALPSCPSEELGVNCSDNPVVEVAMAKFEGMIQEHLQGLESVK